ncbi:MAG: hypothetical protein COA45_09975 [Zetaproteobacteria bacterium]|nr:MAG: hypothetical protein COA45_09975 [Zetaproteobacteria bacterium]
MEKLMTLNNGEDVFFRSVGTDKENSIAKEDYDYCYGLAKRTVMQDVVSLAGEWPEEQQHEFFSSDFYENDNYIVFINNKRAGCFSIHDDGQAIILKKGYIEPNYQGMGIWAVRLDIALDMAHESKKPLKAAILKSNVDMFEMSQRYGFVETEGFLMHGDASWVQMHIVTHQDTLQYSQQPDMFISPE